MFAGVGHVPGMLWRSTRAMGGAVAGWLRPERKDSEKSGESGGEFSARFLGLAVPGYVLVYVTDGRTWLWTVYGGAWFVGCVVLAARRGDLPEADEEPQDVEEELTPVNDHENSAGERPPESATGATSEDQRERKIALIWQQVEKCIAVAVQEGRKGARVADMLTEFQTMGGLLPGWEERQFRELLRSIGIPVREQMYFKVNGAKKNQPGVHVEDLTQALGFTPRLPAHLVPDLTPIQVAEPAPSLVKNDGSPEGREGAV